MDSRTTQIRAVRSARRAEGLGIGLDCGERRRLRDCGSAAGRRPKPRRARPGAVVVAVAAAARSRSRRDGLR